MTTNPNLQNMSDKQFSFLDSLIQDRDWSGSQWIVRIQEIADAIATAKQYPADIDGGYPDATNKLLEKAGHAPVARKGASNLIDELLSLPKKDRHSNPSAPAQLPTAEQVPAGRYAVAADDGHLSFYKVDRPTEGKWAGRVFVRIQTGDDMHPVSFDQTKRVLAKIVEAGAKQASIAYGLEIGACGICGRTLTNAESRELGIGPVCANRMGW